MWAMECNDEMGTWWHKTFFASRKKNYTSHSQRLWKMERRIKNRMTSSNAHIVSAFDCSSACINGNEIDYFSKCLIYSQSPFPSFSVSLSLSLSISSSCIKQKWWSDHPQLYLDVNSHESPADGEDTFFFLVILFNAFDACIHSNVAKPFLSTIVE